MWLRRRTSSRDTRRTFQHADLGLLLPSEGIHSRHSVLFCQTVRACRHSTPHANDLSRPGDGCGTRNPAGWEDYHNNGTASLGRLSLRLRDGCSRYVPARRSLRLIWSRGQCLVWRQKVDSLLRDCLSPVCWRPRLGVSGPFLSIAVTTKLGYVRGFGIHSARNLAQL